MNDSTPATRVVYGLVEPVTCPNPGHDTLRATDGWLRVPSEFNFGNGPTGLDSHLLRFQDHGSPEYLRQWSAYFRQWSAEEWLVAAECWLQLVPVGDARPGAGMLCPCAPVPAWFLDVAGAQLCLDSDTPAPSIGQCFGGEGIDWLGLHAQDPHRWLIEFPFDGAPSLDQVHQVQELVRERGASSGLWINFHSPTAESISGEGTGLEIQWPSAEDGALHDAAIRDLFAGTSTYRAHSESESEQLWLWC